MRDLVRFYLPLLVTSILSHTTRPIISTGIAAAAYARQSLATWPVILGFTWLITGPVWGLQQLTNFLAADRRAFARVARFSAVVSLVLALILAVVAFTPLYDLVFGQVYGLTAPLRDLGRFPLQCLTVYPLVAGAGSVLRGRLIRGGKTSSVRAGTLVGVGTLLLILFVGVARLPFSGVFLAAAATLVGAIAEIVWLQWRGRPA
jgi:hypothetical protein